MTRRNGPWMDLGGGRKFWPIDPSPDEVSIDDIAHALSNICRFGGRCSHFYSVAQHSVMVSRIVARTRPDLALHGLLHDAAEAYLGDVIAPLKHDLWLDVTPFATVEARVLDAIMTSLRLPDLRPCDYGVIKQADLIALATEARDLMGDPRWDGLPDPLIESITPVDCIAARYQFKDEFRRLRAAIGASHATS